MKNKTIKIRREEWNYLRSFKRAPIYKSYVEKVKIRELIEEKRGEYEGLF
jgi:hypothetical protein